MHPGCIRTVPLLTFAGAREVDRRTLHQDPRGETFAENSEILLMGLAASSALHALEADGLLDPTTGTTSASSDDSRPLIFLCGSGNNGGDGLALAYLLSANPERSSRAEAQFSVFAKLPMRSKASRYYQQRLIDNGVKIRSLEDFLAEALPGSNGKAVIIEALLGTGQSGVPSGLYEEVLARMKPLTRHGGSIVALDVPAGLIEENPPSFDRAQESEALPRPDYIYTFGREKAALRLHPDLTDSRIRALPCGFAPRAEESVEDEQPLSFRRVAFPPDQDWLSSTESRFGRNAADHKYSAGHAWVVGGSGGMEGAVLMTLRGFFASGGGYARLFHPDLTSRELFMRVFPPGLYHSMDDLPGSQGGPGRPPRVILVGPGLSLHDLKRFSGRILEMLHTMTDQSNEEVPRLPSVILDAAACQLAFREDYPDLLRERTILTPHAGEWNELGGPPPAGVAGAGLALDFLQSRAGVSALLKGPISLLLRDRKIDVFDWVRPELAAAGSGDLLAGLLARALAAGNVGSPKAKAGIEEDGSILSRMEKAVHQAMALLHTVAAGRSSAADFLVALEHWNLPGRSSSQVDLKDR